MKCPRCESSKMRVIDSREGVDGRSVRRRRECESCEFRFTTFERIEESLPMVIKKGGQRESFDRDKVLSGMRRACEKRPVSVLDLEEAVKNIETILLEGAEKEISSDVIGSLVSESLKALDQVAYVRFASVYKEFSDVNEFFETLNQLSTQGLSTQCISNQGIGVQKTSLKNLKAQETGIHKEISVQKDTTTQDASRPCSSTHAQAKLHCISNDKNHTSDDRESDAESGRDYPSNVRPIKKNGRSLRLNKQLTLIENIDK